MKSVVLNFARASLLLLSIVFSLTINLTTIKSHKKHNKGLLKQILGMQSVILSFSYAYYTIDNKKPSINGSLRYIAGNLTFALNINS